jgi:leucyl aminopeptidase
MAFAWHDAPMTTYALRNASPAKTKADAVVVGVLQTPKGPVVVDQAHELAEAWGRKFRPLLSSLGVTGKAGEVAKFPSAGVVNAALVVLVGLGEAPEGGPTAATVRRAAGTAARAVPNAASVAMALGSTDAAGVGAALEGWLLGGYTFATYKKDTKTDSAGPSEVVVLSESARKAESIAAFESAQVVAEAVIAAREWVNLPPNDLNPPTFAEAVAAAHAQVTKGKSAPEVTLTTYDEKQLADLGCGGILAVGLGSSAPPRLVELSYAPDGATTHLALVGKGITFDSGGLTIKPANSMGEMKSDMAGAAAVVQAIFAIAKLGLPIRVTAYAPMAENMISGSAMRPGDVVTAANGTTVEVLNTDAEGRLILMDALVRAAAEKPDVLVDVATLTGHMVIALGDKIAGVMGTEEIVADVLSAGEAAGELLWPMPIPEEMTERIMSSKIADLSQHDWVRWGGGVRAAAFLREFTDGLPWAHVDIAGPSFNSGGASGHVTPGGTGFGVATLVEYARTLAAGRD